MGHPHLYVIFSLRLSVHPSVRLSVAHHTSETVLHLIIIFGTHVPNDDISKHFFHFLEIFIFWAIRGENGKKNSPKWKVTITSVTRHISGTVSMWSWFLVQLCKMMISPGVFFIFYETLIFWVVKGQKIVQNEKWQLHLSRAISQQQYSIWSWFLVHLCKMMISPGVFFIFLKFSFFGLLWG